MIKYLLPVLLLFFIGCSDGATNPGATNKAPVAEISAEKITVNVQEPLLLSAEKSRDSDGKIVSYRWSEDGTRLGTDSNITIRANEVGQHIITLTVFDDDGASDQQSIMIEVTNGNLIAKIVATPNSVVLGNSIRLDGSGSTNSNGTISKYEWKTSDSQTFNSAVATWKPTTVGSHTVTLTVTDEHGLKATETASVNVTSAPNQSPISRISSSTRIVPLGGEVRLDGSASSDSDGSIVSYEWKFGSTVLSSSALYNWTAPNSVGSYTLSLTVTDNVGSQSTETITIIVVDTASSFTKIKDLIASRQAIYIMVGDSTRAESAVNQSQLLFERVKATLDTYATTSYLEARGGHELRQFNNPALGQHPTYEDVVRHIDGNGSTAIVDMSLGINDLFNQNVTTAELEVLLKDAIALIKNEKPETTFFLTSPNAISDWDGGTEIIMQAYRNVASELSIPFVDFYDNVYVHYTTQEQQAMYLDAVHYKVSGLETVADYILSQIKPN